VTKKELISKYGGTTKDWRKVGEAWRYVKEMEVRSAWLARERPLQKPQQ